MCVCGYVGVRFGVYVSICVFACVVVYVFASGCVCVGVSLCVFVGVSVFDVDVVGVGSVVVCVFNANTTSSRLVVYSVK